MKTKVILALAAVLVAALGALAVTGIVRANRNARITSCAGNLRHLWTMQINYSHLHGGPLKTMSLETGSAFWRALSTTKPPLLEDEHWELYVCPVRGIGGKGEIDYYGPGCEVSLLAGGDPVGCDDPRNHRPGEGGNVLKKSGDVLSYSAAEFSALLSSPRRPIR